MSEEPARHFIDMAGAFRGMDADGLEARLAAETLRADKAEATVADSTHEIIAALYKAWPDAEDIPSDFPLGIIGCIEQIIGERNAVEAQLSALRASLEPVVEAVEDLTPLKFTQYPALAKVVDWLRGPARSFVRGGRE